MKNVIRKTYLIVLGSLFVGTMAFAKTVYVKKIPSGTVDSASAETVYELIKEAVLKVDGHALSMSKSNSEYVLVPKVLKLGDSYILKISKQKGNEVVYSSKMKAANLDDMDTVTTRVVRSVLKEVSTDDSVTVKDVTEEETTRYTRRYQATRQWRFMFGPAWSKNLNVDGAATSWGLGYLWGMDPNVDLKLNWTIYVPKDSSEDDARFVNLSVGVNYFFSDAQHSPFVTAGLGYATAAASENNSGLLNLSDDTVSGWAVTAGAGYKFFRASTVNVGLVGEYTILASKTSKTEKSPSVITVNIVLYY